MLNECIYCYFQRYNLVKAIYVNILRLIFCKTLIEFEEVLLITKMVVLNL